jgi:hypothetical protein
MSRPARRWPGGVLLACGAAAAALLAGGTAHAAACGPKTQAGTPCTLTGSVGLAAGALAVASPAALSWGSSVNGNDQQLVDPNSAEQSYLVSDASASGAGWHVTVSATTFTSSADALPDAGTFQTNGSITAEAATTAPAAACSAGSTCLLPANTTAYPVAITTAASAPAPVTIYDTSAGTGRGSIIIGTGASRVGWWINVPANADAGAYASVISLQVISGP